MTIKDELNEFRQGLLGFTAKLSSTPRKVHDALDSSLARVYLHNQQLKEANTKGALLGHKTANRDLLAKSLSNMLSDAHKQNHDLKQDKASEHHFKPPGHRR